MKVSIKTRKILLGFQRNEITEHLIYKKLSQLIRNKQNARTLQRISKDEKKHYNAWKRLTGKEVRPSLTKYWFYITLSMIFGVTFGMKLMESGEDRAQDAYGAIIKLVPGAKKIINDEEKHENFLLKMLKEEKLKYLGSVVLGLNDALVELTGTLAGLTFALQNAKLVGVAGMITGIAASLSMAASEYLSTKSESDGKNPLRSSFYTGITYVFAVTMLILPYLLFDNYILCLFLALCTATLLIFIFTFYISVVKSISFKWRFIEMVSICLGVSALSFLIGLAVRIFLGINI